MNLRQQLSAIDNDTMLDTQEKAKMKQNFILMNNINYTTTTNSHSQSIISTLSTSATMSSGVPAFYPDSSNSTPSSTLGLSNYTVGDNHTVGSILGKDVFKLRLIDIRISLTSAPYTQRLVYKFTLFDAKISDLNYFSENTQSF